MSTCKDCLHFDVCEAVRGRPDLVGKNSLRIAEKHCPYNSFSDKSEWCHLPCKVGTQVFFLRDKNNIIETSVEKIIFKGKDGKGCYIKLECNAMYETSCQSIGKTVFLTREEAKKALEERKEDEGK